MNKYKTKWKENPLSRGNPIILTVVFHAERFECINVWIRVSHDARRIAIFLPTFLFAFFYKGTNAGAGEEEKTMASIILVMSVQFCYFFPPSFSAFFFFSDGCCCKILDENGWSFSRPPIKECWNFHVTKRTGQGTDLLGYNAPIDGKHSRCFSSYT